MRTTPSAWMGGVVLVTGHTGFKGSWLTLWLHRLGALVHGYATQPPTHPSLFEVAGVQSALASDTRADLSDLVRLRSVFKTAQPEVVFHLAAQPLVTEGYKDPVGTLVTNVIGTAHVMEAAREVPSVRAIVVVTTDKVYQSHDSSMPRREIDPLGGNNPYSASKAATELVAASYRASFFSGHSGRQIQVATVRAGNVIGGGDWADNRLVPDCLRAFTQGEPVKLRYPNAIRPWQHVLEPLSGYLQLAERLLTPDGKQFADAWNFGPDASGDVTVSDLAQSIARLWGRGAQVVCTPSAEASPETEVLRLDSTRARIEIPWQPRWSLNQALQETVAWHRSWMQGADMRTVSLDQIRAYEAARAIAKS